MSTFRAAAMGVGVAMVLGLVGCSSPGREFAMEIQEAHGVDAWHAQDALEADIEVVFDGKTAFDGRIVMSTDGYQCRLTSWDGPVIYNNWKGCFVHPADADIDKPRFHANTWSYFLCAPFKLLEPGVKIELTGTKPIWTDEYDTAKLTFDAGTGDTPDDWYLLYRQPSTGLLRSMAYIVTYGTTADKAQPHAVIFNRFVVMDGVKIPTDWTFLNWSEDKGVSGTPIGQVILANLRWIETDSDTFRAPEGAVMAEMPMKKE